jgi:hypothetical protein
LSTQSFYHDQLEQYAAHRAEGLAVKSIDWLNLVAEALRACTKGIISAESMAALRTFVLERYSSLESHKKVLSFTTAFLKYLSEIKVDQGYSALLPFWRHLKNEPGRWRMMEHTPLPHNGRLHGSDDKIKISYI